MWMKRIQPDEEVSFKLTTRSGISFSKTRCAGKRLRFRRVRSCECDEGDAAGSSRLEADVISEASEIRSVR